MTVSTVFYVVLDISGSMGPQLQACLQAIGELVAICQLLPQIVIRVVVFSDYCDPYVCEISPPDCDLVTFVRDVRILGGGDHPEAHKTALFTVLQEHRRFNANLEEPCPGVVIFLTDAPPHAYNAGCFTARSSSNDVKERDWFATRNYTPCWISLIRDLKDVKVTVSSLLYNNDGNMVSYYCTAAAMTGGLTLCSKSRNVSHIRQQLLGLILGYLGQNASIDNVDAYEAMPNAGQLSTEASMARVFKCTQFSVQAVCQLQDGDFRVHDDNVDHAVTTLCRVIDDGQILTIADNPVFAAVWRSLSAKRLSHTEQIERLVGKFGTGMTKLSLAGQAKMQSWLEESYNNNATITDATVNYLQSLADGAYAKYYLSTGDMGVTARELVTMLRDLDESIYPSFYKVLPSIQVVELTKEEAFEKLDNIVPVDMENVWSYIPHLFVRGAYVPSRRLQGCLCLLSVMEHNTVLTQPAYDWLQARHGKWIDRKDRMCFNYQMTAIGIANPQFFTADELNIYMRINGAYRVYGAIAKMDPPSFQVRGNFQLDNVNEQLYPCVTCGQQRPATFMTGSIYAMTCVACTWTTGVDAEYRKNLPADPINLYSACTKCGDYYTRVTTVSASTPMCHYCCTGESKYGMHVVCRTCTGSRVYPLLLDGNRAAKKLLMTYSLDNGVYYCRSCPLCNHASISNTKKVKYQARDVPELRQRVMDIAGVHCQSERCPTFCDPELVMDRVTSVELRTPLALESVVQKCVDDIESQGKTPRHYHEGLVGSMTTMFSAVPVIAKTQLVTTLTTPVPVPENTPVAPLSEDDHPCVFVMPESWQVRDFMEFDTPVFGGRPFVA